MKKIDLHIHTISTISDVNFNFDLDILETYVKTRSIDAIAITNHNLFDIEQFKKISTRLSFITVFPGIEINIGENCGHMLVISTPTDVEDFSQRCNKVQQKVMQPNDYLTLHEFKYIFGDLRRYLIIPHYHKKTCVDKNIVRELKNMIECGEVNSIKKFMYCQKNNDSLTPVYFSDFRPSCENLNEFPIRQTYLDVDEITLGSIKLCLKDKMKVSLTEEESHSMFYALPDLQLSTGLNIIIGGRSSGKSYTLDQIYEFNNINTKYIKQFSLLEKEPKKAEEDFTRELNIQQSSITKDYFTEFIKVVDEIKCISLEDDEMKLDTYISSLLKHASETERSDMFSKCNLFSESEFKINELSKLKKIINAVESLLDTTQYKSIIEKFVRREDLISLHEGLIMEYINENDIVLKKCWTNDLVSFIKSSLQSNTASTRINDVDFYEIMINKLKVSRFEKIVENLKNPREIYRKELQGFTIVANTKLFLGAKEMKNLSGKQVAFSDAFKLYNEPYEFLRKVKDVGIDDTTYYKYFMNVEYKILNQYGYEVSGGERAEFNLLKEIDDAYQQDLLLIDEPESSFDNLFLKDRVNTLLKSISKELPVIIVTHSSTVGASIKPDYIIFTEREVTKSGIKYKRYSGRPSNKQLVSNEGETIYNINATLDCLEAGNDAYLERGENYEMLRNI